MVKNSEIYFPLKTGLLFSIKAVAPSFISSVAKHSANCFISKSDKINAENYLARAVLAKLPTQLKQAYHHKIKVVKF